MNCKMMRLSLESSKLLVVQANALKAEHIKIRDSLNVEAIVYFLNSKSLLTTDETYRLMDKSQPYGTRIDFLVEILPRKESDWWDKFLQCLNESSDRPGLGVHKELVKLLKNQFDHQLRKYEQKSSLIWLPMKLLKRLTTRHHKTAVKVGTIMAILVVALCTLQRSTTINTIVIGADISDDNNKTSKLEYKHDITTLQAILKVLAPISGTTKNSPHSNTVLTTAPTYPSEKSTQNILKHVNNKTHDNSEDATKKQAANNNISHALFASQKFTNKSMVMQTTSKTPETHHTTINHYRDQGITEGKQSATEHLTNSNTKDFEIMQKQLNLTYCLIFYIEKEKMEYAKLDLWGVYVILKTATNTKSISTLANTTVTATEVYITKIIETLTGWKTEDITKNQQITQIKNELEKTMKLVQQMKDFLSLTDVNTMRIYQNGYKLSDQFLSQQLLKNYESETTLLNLKHQLYIERPTVAPNNNMSDVLDSLIYYPLLQKYMYHY